MDKLCGLLLASRSFARFGRFVPLLPWSGGTLFEHQLSSLERCRPQAIMAVLGHRAQDLVQLTVFRPRVRKVVDPRYVRGNLSALRVGLHALKPVDRTAILVLPVEFPVDAEYLEAFASRGMEELREGAAAVMTGAREANSFPALLGPEAAAWCMHRPVRDDSLRTRMIELGATAIPGPRVGHGGPTISNLREYEETRDLFQKISME